jgi:NAD(P)-dependent dehydrogenase (short-subunit alcohol dehydrogenase family)
MAALEDRVTIITGAGNGIGREHALLFASEGAKVVVNDLGGNPDGTGADASAAQKVVDEIVAAGGEAVANHDDVGDYAGAGNLIAQAIDTYGRLDVLVNNAGILRDAFFHRMTEEEWDIVLKVHLKGHFNTTRNAVDHWRERSKAGEDVKGAVINTASGSGTFLPNPGQANYGTAKAAIAAFTMVLASELSRIGVRVNAIAPIARTRLTENVPGPVGAMFAKPEDPDALDVMDPANISPMVAWLATEDCPVNGRMYAVQGGQISALSGWSMEGDPVKSDEPWTLDSVTAALGAARV